MHLMHQKYIYEIFEFCKDINEIANFFKINVCEYRHHNINMYNSLDSVEELHCPGARKLKVSNAKE